LPLLPCWLVAHTRLILLWLKRPQYLLWRLHLLGHDVSAAAAAFSGASATYETPAVPTADGNITQINGIIAGAIPKSQLIEAVSKLRFLGLTGLVVPFTLATGGGYDLKVTLLDPNYNPFGGDGNIVLLDRVRNGEGGSSGSCTADGLLGNAGDDASTSADAACAATGGSGDVIGWVRPSQPLAALAGRRGTDGGGTSTVGTWTLVVRDLASSDAGQLNNWSIAVECTDTAPSDELFKNSFE